MRAVAEQIERYLERHPSAADSLQGIATWWVTRQSIRKELPVVHAALQRLAEQGVVAVERDTHAREPVYRLKKSD